MLAHVVCPFDEPPADARRSGASLGSRRAGACQPPESVTCAVSDRWSAKILNERGAIRYALSRRERAPPGRPRRPARHGQRPPAGLRPWQPPGFGPPTCRLRQLALERSHHAQYRSDRLCPVVAGGLRQIRRRALRTDDKAKLTIAVVGDDMQVSA
jgi:hypothetical protein